MAYGKKGSGPGKLKAKACNGTGVPKMAGSPTSKGKGKSVKKK